MLHHDIINTSASSIKIDMNMEEYKCYDDEISTQSSPIHILLKKKTYSKSNAMQSRRYKQNKNLNKKRIYNSKIILLDCESICCSFFKNVIKTQG